jgi:hypothetical protein
MLNVLIFSIAFHFLFWDLQGDSVSIVLEQEKKGSQTQTWVFEPVPSQS